MCMVSNIGDGWGKGFPSAYPWAQPAHPNIETITPTTPPTRAEFDALRNEMEELRTLLVAAKAFDEATGQPDCEADEKVALIRRMAELVGVDMEDTFGGDV